MAFSDYLVAIGLVLLIGSVVSGAFVFEEFTKRAVGSSGDIDDDLESLRQAGAVLEQAHGITEDNKVVSLILTVRFTADTPIDGFVVRQGDRALELNQVEVIRDRDDSMDADIATDGDLVRYDADLFVPLSASGTLDLHVTSAGIDSVWTLYAPTDTSKYVVILQHD